MKLKRKGSKNYQKEGIENSSLRFFQPNVSQLRLDAWAEQFFVNYYLLRACPPVSVSWILCYCHSCYCDGAQRRRRSDCNCRRLFVLWFGWRRASRQTASLCSPALSASRLTSSATVSSMMLLACPFLSTSIVSSAFVLWIWGLDCSGLISASWSSSSFCPCASCWSLLAIDFWRARALSATADDFLQSFPPICSQALLIFALFASLETSRPQDAV